MAINVQQSILENLHPRLIDLYGDEVAAWLLETLATKASAFRRLNFFPDRAPPLTERDAMLIAHANSIVGQRIAPMQALHEFLREHIGYKLTMLHVLPFFPCSSEDGYAVMDLTAVNDELGTWEDLQVMGGDYRMMVDGVFNHASAHGNIFQGYLSGDPKFADFFIEVPPDMELDGIRRIRDGALLHDYQTHEGVKLIWGSYGRDTLDLNFANPHVLLHVLECLLFYVTRGIALLSLNAAPLLWKEAGTSCANLDRTHELVKVFRDFMDLACPHVRLLADACEPDEENYSFLGDGTDEAHLVYNYCLPPLLLYCLLKGDASILSEWATNMPALPRQSTYLNVTATHENIGLDPTQGYLNDAARRFLVDITTARGGKVINRTDSMGRTVPCELSVNYYEAINDSRSDDDLDVQISRFVLSQAVPLSLQGIPGIYIHSLLGSRQESEAVTQLSPGGAAAPPPHPVMHQRALERQLADANSVRSRIFADLSHLLDLRAHESAFRPTAEQTILQVGDSAFTVRRHNPDTGSTVICLHNFSSTWAVLETTALGASGRMRDMIDQAEFEISRISLIRLAPYQVRWLKSM